MAINPYQNAAQNIYAASGTGGGTITSTYYDTNIPNPIMHRMFSTPIAESNPYRSDDVTLDMLTKLQVYTSSILAGDIKTVNQEYLYAMQIVVSVLKRAKTRVTDETIEHIWAKATAMDGNVVESYTKELLYVLGINR
jgi:hypothetical protein